MAARFSELSEDELSCLLEEKNSENTKKATKTAVSVFRQYLQARKISKDICIQVIFYEIKFVCKACCIRLPCLYNVLILTKDKAMLCK